MGSQWALKAPLPLPQFADAGEHSLLHSSCGLSIEIFFENSEFMLYRAKKETQVAKLQIVDCQLWINYAVVPQGVPRSLTQKFPFTQYDLLSWNANANQLETYSGTSHLQNFPSRAIIFVTPSQQDNLDANPFEFKPYHISEVTLTANEYVHHMAIDIDSRNGINVYANLVRALKPAHGKFAIKNRNAMESGYFLVCFDLTRSGRFGLGDLDQPSLKTPCVLNVSTRHTMKLGIDLTFHCMFLSAAAMQVTEGDQLSIDYL